jgi:hypothetical protein
MLTKSYRFLLVLAITFPISFLIKILVFSLPDDALKEIDEAGP